MSYAKSAEFYDLLYAWKDYARECERLHELVRKHNPGARSLLDVACGTGQHLYHLRRWYDIEGLDSEPAFLEIARRRLGRVPLHLADMRSFRLNRTFDIVTCLFSAIGYMRTPDELAAAITAMTAHLRPGGLLLLEPWLAPGSFDPRHIGGPTIGQGDDVKVARMNGSRVEGRLSVMDFHYLVGRPGRVEHFVEVHSLALYTDEEYRAALEASGLVAERDEHGLMGRGIWIASR